MIPTGVTAQITSFRHAAEGLWTILASQRNARVHACATAVVISMGLALRITPHDWCWLILAVATVWTAEALNTALEFLADAATPQLHPLVKKSKDAAAGGVLAAAIGAAVIGLIILLPHAVKLLGCWILN